MSKLAIIRRFKVIFPLIFLFLFYLILHYFGSFSIVDLRIRIWKVQNYRVTGLTDPAHCLILPLFLYCAVKLRLFLSISLGKIVGKLTLVELI
jgi:hypothetical protein